jgi:hypothetical protein
MLERMFGASWRTSLTMYLLAIIGVAQEVIKDNGFPTTALGWMTIVGSILVGIAGRLAKDANVSNAPVPDAPKPVV